MSEAEIISELGFRAEVSWNLLQWWVSISFAVMVAAFWGSRRLTNGIVAVIIGLYSMSTVMVFLSISNQGNVIYDLNAALRVLSDSGELSVVGLGALSRLGQDLGTVLRPFWVGFSFFFTIGFVFYCLKHEEELE